MLLGLRESVITDLGKLSTSIYQDLERGEVLCPTHQPSISNRHISWDKPTHSQWIFKPNGLGHEKEKEIVLSANQPPHNEGVQTTEGKTHFC